MRRQVAIVFAAFILLLSLAAPLWAVEPSERLPDPVQEARARELGSQLRCLVCQNTSIDESNATLARDLRLLIRERIKAGDSNAQVMQFMLRRYGQFVLLKPLFTPTTYLLWLGPPILLFGGFAAMLLRARRKPPLPMPLSDEEQRRAAQLLGATGGGGRPL